eukprot:SAG22_NODE_110_length_19679_cov_45.046527_5_plen_108_part_00
MIKRPVVLLCRCPPPPRRAVRMRKGTPVPRYRYGTTTKFILYELRYYRTTVPTVLYRTVLVLLVAKGKIFKVLGRSEGHIRFVWYYSLCFETQEYTCASKPKSTQPL